MQTIDHDPHEPRLDRTPGPWRWVFPVILAVIGVNLFTGQLSWPSFLGGVGAGGVLAAWAIEISGNKVPESWKSKPRRDGN